MVESSAAALKVLLSRRRRRSFRTHWDKRKGHRGNSVSNPLGLPVGSTTISSCVDGGSCRIRLALPNLPHQGSPKKTNLTTTCCSEPSSLVSGELLRSPPDIHWPFTHRGTVVCPFNRFLILDADGVALGVRIATKERSTTVITKY